MILVDSSIWIDHFRCANQHLIALMDRRAALMHPFVLGELAGGNLPSRQRTLATFKKLPHILSVSNEEVLYLIESRKLFGLGIGFLDMHLLCSALIKKARLWSRDRRLNKAASDLQIAYMPPPDQP